MDSCAIPRNPFTLSLLDVKDNFPLIRSTHLEKLVRYSFSTEPSSLLPDCVSFPSNLRSILSTLCFDIYIIKILTMQLQITITNFIVLTEINDITIRRHINQTDFSCGIIGRLYKSYLSFKDLSRWSNPAPFLKVTDDGLYIHA